MNSCLMGQETIIYGGGGMEGRGEGSGEGSIYKKFHAIATRSPLIQVNVKPLTQGVEESTLERK